MDKSDELPRDEKTNSLADIKRKRLEWEERYDKSVKKHPEHQGKFLTTSSKLINPLYDPTDLPPTWNYSTDLGYPSSFPFTRGVQPTMYRGRLWTMRQFAGFGGAEETNKRFKFLLANGMTGLSVAFHLPTIYGRESDHPMSLGEVGKLGVAIDTLKDMEILFDGIPLDKVTTSMTINAPASILLAMYIAVAEKQGVRSDQIGGTIQNDILKEYIAQKSYIFPPKPSMRIIMDIIKYCSTHVPRWNTISISGYHIREAGSTAVQELAFTLVDGLEYVKWAVDAGLDIDDFAPRLSFFFNSHNDLFEEIAKYRAARRIWARHIKKYQPKNPRSFWLRFHTQTAGCSLTAQQPQINVVRTTIQALAAVLGGTQSLHTNSLDEALALPSEEAVEIALRTQQIIAHESGVTNTIDPLAGSYFVEALTNEMEEEVEEYFTKITQLGGVIPAIEKGFFQLEIANAAYQYQKEIEENQRIIVGVNEYSTGDEIKVPLLQVDEEVAKRQIERLHQTKKERDNDAVRIALENIRKAAEGTDNLMPPILEAVKAYASVGEICDILREVFGEWKGDTLI
ncbi:MAG: methylmalonyl-CoA mutase family protein [Candidatus Heimdallarchaeota archaeon]|nr:MAG: methylmalonyl-CoA mutase family protein [Candidatus Heimdallarchaeota archaeon]